MQVLKVFLSFYFDFCVREIDIVATDPVWAFKAAVRSHVFMHIL